MKALALAALALVLSACSSSKLDRVSWDADEVAGLKIITLSGSDEEKQAKTTLTNLLKGRRLDAYFFSPKVFISSSKTGKGVPQPSLPARLAGQDDAMLTEFLKTQHLYFVYKKHASFDRVLPILKELFPKLPREAFLEQAPAEPDLYRELVVQYLTFRALRNSLSADKAPGLLVGSIGNKVVQENAVKGEALLGNILKKYQLIPEE